MSCENKVVFSFIKKALQPFRWNIAAQFCTAAVWASYFSLNSYMLKMILDMISLFPTSKSTSHLWKLIFFYFFAEIVLIFTFRFYDWLLLHSRPLMKKHIATIIMDHMMGQSHGVYQQHFSGTLANKVVDVSSGIPNIIKAVVEQFFGYAITLSVATWTLWTVGPRFGIGFILWTGFLLGVSLWALPRGKILSTRAAERRSAVTGQLVDIFANMMNVRLFSGRSSEHTHMARIYEASMVADRNRAWFFLSVFGVQGTSFALFQACCLYWLVEGFVNSSVTAGDFALVLTLNSSVFGVLWNFLKDIKDFSEDMGNVTQGLDLLTLPYQIQDSPSARQIAVPQGAITFDQVNFTYRDTDPVFRNKSVEIKPGQKVGLVGSSGSGKSTFVHLILRLFDVESGRILIDGQDIREVSQDSLRRAISMIPQDPSLFNRTLLENIRYGRPEASDEEIFEAARRADAHDFIMALPDGYHTLVGERGSRLSGGQRQRIAIARAFVKNAPILILDEATSQLDSLSEWHIQKTLWSLMDGKTAIVIAHRLSTLLSMDRILVFHKGQITEDGPHDLLIAQNGFYKTLWETQVGGFLSTPEIES